MGSAMACRRASAGGVRVRRDRFAVGRKADGNPEGKGLNGFLLDWYQSEPRGIVEKPRGQVLAEFFTSMLVLSAKFKHKPVVGKPYYLYWIDDEWRLSLIAPDEWSVGMCAGFAGTCVLQRDMIWTISPADRLKDDNPVSDAIDRYYDAFAEMLNTDREFDEILPYYVGKLPYYQRLYASALSRSIRGTVALDDRASWNCREWRTEFLRLERLLLPHRK